MTRSLGGFLWKGVETLLDGAQRPYDERSLESAIAATGREAAAIERALAEREANDRAEQRKRQAIEMKDPATGRFPAHVVNAALASWPTETTAMRHAREYLASRKLVIVLAGGTGTGKSTAAAFVALEAGGSTPGFIRASALERRGRYSKTLDAWLDTRSMLVLDDLGAEYMDTHGAFRSLLDEVIDTFYGRDQRVVITTNLRQRQKTPDEQAQFVERYGDRVASRLSEVGLWSECGARDLRRDQLRLSSGARS